MIRGNELVAAMFFLNGPSWFKPWSLKQWKYFTFMQYSYIYGSLAWENSTWTQEPNPRHTRRTIKLNEKPLRKVPLRSRNQTKDPQGVLHPESGNKPKTCRVNSTQTQESNQTPRGTFPSSVRNPNQDLQGKFYVNWEIEDLQLYPESNRIQDLQPNFQRTGHTNHTPRRDFFPGSGIEPKTYRQNSTRTLET